MCNVICVKLILNQTKPNQKMKFKLLTALFLFPLLTLSQVGINTTTPDVSSALDITSSDSGLLIPRMTMVQRDAIANPANGLLIYQTDNTMGFYYYDGIVWTPLNYGAADDDWALSSANLYNTNSGNVGIGTTVPTAKLHVDNTSVQSVLFNQDFETSFTPITTNGDALWSTQSSNVNNGTAAAVSGTINDSQASNIEHTITIPASGATISFYYEVSSELNYDFLKFYIDGVEQGSWSGEITYTQQTYNLTAGPHTLRWSYEKDGSESRFNDAVYVDDILIYTIDPNETPSFRLVDGNQSDGYALISDANGNATWQELTSANIANIPQFVSAQGLRIPICNSNPVGSTGAFVVPVNGVSTTVSWEVLGRRTTAGSVVDISGNNVLVAPFNPESLQVKYDFSPALPFAPNALVFSANNSSSFPDNFSLNYIQKSTNSLTMSITRIDTFGDTSSDCWSGQFYFDMLITD